MILTPETIQHGQKVLARQGLAGATGAVWGLWRERELYVQRRDKAYKDRGIVHPVGELLMLTLQDVNCAEYGPDDYDLATDTWLVEDSYMQIRTTEEA